MTMMPGRTPQSVIDSGFLIRAEGKRIYFSGDTRLDPGQEFRTTVSVGLTGIAETDA